MMQEFIIEYIVWVLLTLLIAIPTIVVFAIKGIITYKCNNKTELKKSQYAQLAPKQNEIVHNLHLKFNKLKRISDIQIRYNALMEQNINSSDNDDLKDDDKIIVKTEFIPVYPNDVDYGKASFSAEELLEMMKLEDVNKDISQYIEENRIYLPEQLYKLVYTFCPMVNVLLVLNTPEIKIRAELQEQGYTPSESADLTRNEINLDTESIKSIIVSYISLIDDEFRKLIGVS